MKIMPSGYVGIGTSNPGKELDVNGSIRLSTSGTIEGRSYPYTTNIGSGANATTTYIVAGSTAKTEIELSGGDTNSNIVFKTPTSGNVTTTALTIDTNQDATFTGDVNMASATITGDVVVQGTLTAQEFRTELTTSTVLYDSGSTKFGDTSDDNHDFTGSLNVQGNVEHTGLTMTSGTDIDQLYTTTKSLTLTTDWQDTGINGTDLATGTYVVALYAHDHSVNGGHYYETYSGTMTWYQNDTNDTTADEIILHKAGHHSGSGNIYLRTKRTATADTDDLKLQIAHTATCTGNSNYVFKFRRLI
jgi:hypothetical protein